MSVMAAACTAYRNAIALCLVSLLADSLVADPRDWRGDVSICTANLLQATTNENLCHLEYSLVQPLHGVFLTNHLYVVYYTKCPPERLTTNALLVLQFDPDLGDEEKPRAPKSGDYIALGGDGWRGILEDTPANRTRVLAAPERLAENTPENRLPREKAVAIAWRAVTRHIGSDAIGEMRVETIARDHGYGWAVLFAWFKERRYGTGTVVVGDVGLVRDVYGFPPPEWIESYRKHGELITGRE